VNGPNRMDSYHEEIGDEDAMSYASECEYEEDQGW
jgi:hypothetical protein